MGCSPSSSSSVPFHEYHYAKDHVVLSRKYTVKHDNVGYPMPYDDAIGQVVSIQSGESELSMLGVPSTVKVPSQCLITADEDADDEIASMQGGACLKPMTRYPGAPDKQTSEAHVGHLETFFTLVALYPHSFHSAVQRKRDRIEISKFGLGPPEAQTASGDETRTPLGGAEGVTAGFQWTATL
mmetsp:Transcript_22210/g.50726  ORF Transcript_22210/g.50726 Transcript_22210/m.50726 type:complete len:183 (-) Transcript_22210:40-588(-)